MKRLMDLVICLTLITVLLLIFIIVAITVRVKLGTPILFKQLRPGLYGKGFYLFKFRTMNNLIDKNGYLKSDQDRLTTVGSFLRRYSLDEIPQLFNVLKGEMSLVGPRPLLMEYLPLYTEEQKIRHNVKPGITGWAQVNGRNEIDWEAKFNLDTWYVKNRNILLDIKIILLTLSKVVKKEGINHQGHVTMGKFKGSKEVI
ncbi:sugar transferase [Aquibacillus halophilus]|uniref:Sugar transferase n=1 Tax=Aquibacillus halophilus TaxID=930132 RepID=A0A6A8DN68_9BACI|nr:sugar transferase [Aquibacillus halophilus]MRH42692.1 sugar transferase [Aquibacillus halophilus]